jgi:hypothetical protein
MNTSGIEALLEKYYEGTTTLQEEKILRDFFRNTDVYDNLKSHQKMLEFFTDEHGQEIKDKGFDQNLTQRLADESMETPIISMNASRNRFVFISSIAASILLLIGLFFTYRQDVFRKEKPMRFTANQEIAFAEANEALLIVSANLNAGLKQVEHLQMVDMAMKNVQLFNRFYQYQTIIINPDEISNQSIKSK